MWKESYGKLSFDGGEFENLVLCRIDAVSTDVADFAPGSQGKHRLDDGRRCDKGDEFCVDQFNFVHFLRDKFRKDLVGNALRFFGRRRLSQFKDLLDVVLGATLKVLRSFSSDANQLDINPNRRELLMSLFHLESMM